MGEPVNGLYGHPAPLPSIRATVVYPAPGKRPYTLITDVDGTLCEDQFPAIGAPVGPVAEALRALCFAGWHVVICSCRVNLATPTEDPDLGSDRAERLRDMLWWLREHGMPFHRVWGLKFDGPAIIKHDKRQIGKPFGDVYWDDKFPLWPLVSRDAQTLIIATEVTAGIRPREDLLALFAPGKNRLQSSAD